jgi:alkylation response protein AidB-like acyl-CoA dehydrogenase
MEKTTSNATQLNDWKQLTHHLGNSFAKRAAQHDEEATFVFENYEDLKALRYFSAAIPSELDGGGVSHADMCNLIRIMAHYCSSTALALSMHQHLVAAAIWRYKHKGEKPVLMEKVVKNQLVLVSTGARDWLDSNGELKKTEGGYLLSGKKSFASQSIMGDVAITSAPYLNPENGWEVLHFDVPFTAQGVSVLDDWYTLGMRATGSQTIVFENVFIPDASIALARPRNGYHAVWDVVLIVALPLIMSAYVGIAEKAMDIALELGKPNQRNQRHLPYIIGKMNNALVSARTQWNAMIALTHNIDFKPSEATTLEMLSLKSNVSNACIQTVSEAMQATGGQSYYQRNSLERLFRDVQASPYHPLPDWEQYAFTGERLLKP